MVLSIGLIIGGYSFILNNDVGDLTDNSIPNELDNSSKDNISLGDGGKVSNGNSNNNQKIANGNSNNGKVAKDISANDLNDIIQVNPIQPISAFADDDIPAMYISVGYAANYNNDNSYHNGAVITPGVFDNINKSEYVLSPNYDEHIFIKIGQDFTDKYGFCIADGFFIPLGNITKEIPADKICKLDCGIADCYFDLSSPYIYDYDNVSYYLEHGEFAPDVIIKQQQAIKDYYDNNYRKLGGHEDIYLNVHQDFTDKYILCMDCGRYVPLGNVTTPLRDIMICDYPTHFGRINYFDIDYSAVITPEEAYNSWDSYLENLYSNPDYHPIHWDEPGYGGDYVEEPNDVGPINDDLPQENSVVENPQIVADFINVG